jgi:hypothetical protein
MPARATACDHRSQLCFLWIKIFVLSAQILCFLLCAAQCSMEPEGIMLDTCGLVDDLWLELGRQTRLRLLHARFQTSQV